MSRQTSGDFDLDLFYDHPMDVNARIYKARKDAGMTQEQLAGVVKKTRGAVAQWESGEVRPRHSTLEAIAKATKKSVAWLAYGGEDEQSVGLKVVGDVAAGLWREAALEYKVTTKPVAAHPDYPPDAQRLYCVSGTSINRVALDGEYLHAVDIKAAGIEPESGDLVIVCRSEHGKAEYTAKTLIRLNGEWLLRPESDDPDWQADIEMNGDDAVEIEITDIVIAKWTPIARRRSVSNL